MFDGRVRFWSLAGAAACCEMCCFCAVLSAAAAAFVLPAAACVAAASTLFVESIPYFLPEPDANLMWPDRIGPLGVD